MDWSEIPEDILETISERLKIYADYIRLRAVCRTWWSLLPRFPRHRLPVQLPWLLLNPLACTFSGYLECYDISTAKTHSINLPQASYPRSIVGSSHGSLIITGDCPTLFCHNPITNSTVFLPPVYTLPGVTSFNYRRKEREYVIKGKYRLGLSRICFNYLFKVVLSDSPTNDACLAMALIGCHQPSELAYCKFGDDTWKPWPCQDFKPQDVIYSQSEDLFYVVNRAGDVAYFSTIDNINIRKNDYTIEGEDKYLVKFKEELLLVSKGLQARRGSLVPKCEVYRFREVGEGTVQWDPVTDLVDLMAFIGLNFSLGLLASDFAGCKGNCIYYTDDRAQPCDAGVYNLSDGEIEELPSRSGDWSLVHSRVRPWEHRPPVWFTPNPS